MKNKILLLRINEHPDIESEINSANANVKMLQERVDFLNKQKDKLVKEVKENREKHWDKLTQLLKDKNLLPLHYDSDKHNICWDDELGVMYMHDVEDSNIMQALKKLLT